MKYRPELRVISPKIPFLQFLYHSPSLKSPALVINGLGYSRGSADWGLFFENQEESELAEILTEYIPELSFIEFCELSRQAPLSRPCRQNLAQKYGWNPSESFWTFVEETKSFPADFKSWMHSKKIQISDVAAFRSLQAQTHGSLNPGPISELQSHLWSLVSVFAEKDLNKQFGVRIFELLVELLLMGQPSENLQAPLSAQDSFHAEDWYEHLRLLRYPETSRRFEIQKSYWTQLPWPKSLQPKFLRQNDKVGMEIKTLIPNLEDLKKTIAGLQMVQRELEKKESLHE